MRRKKIEDLLLVSDEGNRLLNNLERIKQSVSPLLKKIIITFPDFTSHDIDHSDRILEQFNENFPDTLKEKLNEYEIFFLIASIYLHDLGMVKTNDDDTIELAVLQEKIRDIHQVRSENFILKNYSVLSIEDIHQAHIIGRICRGHRIDDLSDETQYPPNKVYQRFSINIQLLSALLRISDELDLTFMRTPFILFENRTFQDGRSKKEWQTHLSISGIAPHPEDSSIIFASARCESQEVHRKLKSIQDKINSQLEELPHYLHQYRDIKKDLPMKFEITIETVGYKEFDFKFSLQEREIINLLMGERLYQNSEESVRELLKNSIDACHLRQESLKKQQLCVKSLITFQQSADENFLILSDNGIGMDEGIIENYFTKIGKSFYKSKEFFDQGLEFAPVSELGIGILSAFMISDKIIVDTKKQGSDALKLEIDNISDYFLASPSDKQDTGTTITLFLKENAKKIDFGSSLKTYAVHIDIPIMFTSIDGKPITIIDKGYKNNFSTSLGSFSKKIGIRELHFNDKNIEGSIGFIFKINNEGEWKNIDRYHYDYELHRFLNQNSLCQRVSYEGIFVNDKNFLKYLVDVDLYDLIVKNNGLDLNVARNAFVQNDKSLDFLNYIEKLFFIELESFLKRIVLEFQIPVESRKYFYRSFIQNRLSFTHYRRRKGDTKQSKPSDELIAFLQKNYYFILFSDSGVEFQNYLELIARKKTICIVLNYSNTAHIKEIIDKCKIISKDYIYIQAEELLSIPEFHLNDEFDSVDINKLIGMRKSNELAGLIPVTYKLYSFRNYTSTRLIEFLYPITINRDNPFINLIIENIELIKGDKKIAIEGFFRTLMRESKKDLRICRNKQIEILKWFTEKNKISETDFEKYLLTELDFPPHYFE